jgi:hypothetical protein
MSKLTDQELEKLLEDYLSTTLSTPPKEGLRIDFSNQLRRTLEKQLEQRNRLRFYVGWGLILILTMGALFFCLICIDATYQTGMVAMIIIHKWVFLIGFLLFFLIQYLDYFSVKQQQFRKIQHQQK